MGASISTNSVNSMLSNVNTIITSYENICSAPSSDANNIFNATNCNLSGNTIVLQSDQVISQTCLQTATTTGSIKSSIKQQITQMAKALTQQFAFGEVGAAQNFINTSATIGDNIADHYTSVCIGGTGSTGLNSLNKLRCTNSTIDNTIITLESYQNSTQQCLSNYITSNNIQSQLVSLLQQTSTATQASTFSYIIFAFVAIIGIFAWSGISLAENPAIQWIIVFLVPFAVISSIVYTITARAHGNYPYTKA